VELFVRFGEKKTNFETYNVSQNLVIFQKKKNTQEDEFTLLFFLTLLFFRPETDKLPKKSQ
jgi:hypothetical protein